MKCNKIISIYCSKEDSECIRDIQDSYIGIALSPKLVKKAKSVKKYTLITIRVVDFKREII